jgi:hypothetical protein
MAEKIVSPGVFTRENDLSFIAQGVGAIGAAIVGPFKKGPAFLPTVINTQSEFEELFGTPDGTYYTGYTVQNYLQEASSVTIVRVGQTGGYTHNAPTAISVSGSSGNTLISALYATSEVSESAGFADASLESIVSASDFNITIGASTITSASILPTSANDVRDVFGDSGKGIKDAYSYVYFEEAASNLDNGDTTINGTVIATELPTQVFSTDILEASTPFIQSQLISGLRYNLFRFHTQGHGSIYNKEFKVSISNVKVASDQSKAAGNFFPTFTVTVRGYDDLDRRLSVIETFPNATLNPASPNYISKLIGDVRTTIDENGKITEEGDYPNQSKFVRVDVSAEGSFPSTAGPFAHGAYTNPINMGDTGINIPAVIFSTGSAENSSTTRTKYSGIDLETAGVKIDNAHYLKPLPDEATTGINTAFSFDGDINALISGTVTTINLGFALTGSDLTDIGKRQFTVAFQGGFDGITPTRTINLGKDITAENSQGFDLSTSTSQGSKSYVKAINSVSNPDDFDINLISAPGVIRRLHSYVFDYIVEMCELREDAFFIGDVTAVNDTIAQAITQGDSVDSNYVGTYYPWVKTIDRNTNRLTAVPPSVLMPGIYVANDTNAAEWWAPAGLNRGGIVGAVSVLNRLTHAERDELYEGKINPIATFPGEGIVAFGQKTLQDAASALDRINVRRLLIKVKKYIASTSRYLVFEQNTAQTRATFINTVNPYLEGIQQRQGLYSFKVVMDESNNTPDVIDRNILKGAIYLQPTRTAEFIVLDFNILPTGAAFSS